MVADMPDSGFNSHRQSKNEDHISPCFVPVYLFQFLIGSLKRVRYKLFRYDYLLVSIPHGSLKTRKLDSSRGTSHVSIPHGSLKTRARCPPKIRQKMFQFLRQSKNVPSTPLSGRFTVTFQFLIGSLKPQFLSGSHAYLPFQFLIGSLKTEQRIYLSSRSTKVSIPHRQSKNRSAGIAGSGPLVVSIPHRQSKNKNTGYGSS